MGVDLPAPAQGPADTAGGRGVGRGQADADRPVAGRGRGRAGSGRGRAGAGRPPSRRRGRGRGRAAAILAPPAPAVSPPALLPAGAPVPRRGRVRQADASLSPNEQRSYKRDRGPLRHPGQPIRELNKPILSKDTHTTWMSTRPDGVPDIIDAQLIDAGGPTPEVAALDSPLAIFSNFLPDEQIEEICSHTNVKMSELRSNFGEYNRHKFTYSNVNLEEMKAFIGCLIMSGIRKDNHLRAGAMFSPVYGCAFYRSLFSQRRFEFLIRAIRFDDQDTRLVRLPDDPFTHIRVLWSAFMQNCIQSYKAGPVVTVDEQLLAFRGRCPFRMYIANKPAKYGIKIFMVCDADTHYCLNAFPYLGRGSATNLPAGVNQGHHFTMQLLEHLQVAGRTVCLDNWFTSINLAKELQEKSMHLVGTLREKPQLPTKTAINDLKLNLKESVAMFDHNAKINVVYKKVKPTKHLPLLTTVHNIFTQVEDQKTEAHMFYNASKGGVDVFDQLCAASSTSRKTRRWPLCIFYGILNIIVNNAWIIWSSQPSSDDRHDFTMAMAYDLCRPWAVTRYNTKARYWSNAVRDMVKSTFNVTVAPAPPDAAPQPPADPQPPVDLQPALADPQPPVDLQPAPAPQPPAPAAQPGAQCPGRRKGDKRQRCRFDDKDSTFSGKDLCSGEACGGKPICLNHSIILCHHCLNHHQLLDHLL